MLPKAYKNFTGSLDITKAKLKGWGGHIYLTGFFTNTIVPLTLASGKPQVFPPLHTDGDVFHSSSPFFPSSDRKLCDICQHHHPLFPSRVLIQFILKQCPNWDKLTYSSFSCNHVIFQQDSTAKSKFNSHGYLIVPV